MPKSQIEIDRKDAVFFVLNKIKKLQTETNEYIILSSVLNITMEEQYEFDCFIEKGGSID
jgi:hypothetical protein